MKAAWYERQGNARDVLIVGEMPDPLPGPGEVRMRVAASGVNPGDVKKRINAFGYGMTYPRVIPHSDGAGIVDMIGADVPEEWVGRRVWCFGAQSYRPSGTAAEFTVVPAHQVVPLPERVSFDVGGCLGIPGITAHRAVHVGGGVTGKTVLVHGAAGAVGSIAVALARRPGARVIGTTRDELDANRARTAGADVVLTFGEDLVRRIREVAPEGVDHIVEVAFASNIALDAEVLQQGGSIATYATDNPSAPVPFWPLVFQNAAVFFLGSDDFPIAEKQHAAHALNDALESGWSGPHIATRFSLDQIALAHEAVEHGSVRGRVVVETIIA